MDELESLLRKRIAETRTRIESYRFAIASEQQALKRWEDALALEMEGDQREIEVFRQLPQTLTLTESRSKEAIIETFLGQAEHGLTSAQLVQLVHPAVARSSVFACLKRMKRKGVVVQNERGFITLTDKLKQQTPP